MEREISFSTKFKRPLNKSAKGQTCSDETLMYDNNYTNNTSNTKSKLFKKVKSEKIGKIKSFYLIIFYKRKEILTLFTKFI